MKRTIHLLLASAIVAFVSFFTLEGLIKLPGGIFGYAAGDVIATIISIPVTVGIVTPYAYLTRRIQVTLKPKEEKEIENNAKT